MCDKKQKMYFLTKIFYYKLSTQSILIILHLVKSIVIIKNIMKDISPPSPHPLSDCFVNWDYVYFLGIIIES